MKNIEVTFREVLVSIIIMLLLLSVGFVVVSKIQEHYSDKNQKYFRALKVEDYNTFNYTIKTEVGGMLSYGEFKATNPVSYKDVKGEYFYIEKVTEKYTRHTRQVSYKCGKITCYRTETYYTWDFLNKDSKHTDSFVYMNNKYPYTKLKFNNTKYIDTQTFGDIRYVYSGSPVKFKGSLYSVAKNKDITQNEVYINKNIKEVLKDKEIEGSSVSTVFWFIWIVLGVVLVIVFVARENRYLNKKFR